MTMPADSTTPRATPGRPHPTMTILTCTETISRDVVHAALVKGATFLRCSIWRQTADNLIQARAGLGLHPLNNTTRGRDAP